MRVLSIDWDYFVGCSIRDRIVKFPDSGNERMGIALSSYIWQTRYAACPDIEYIKVRQAELDKLKKIIDANKAEYFFICADSHMHLGEFLLHPDMEEKISKTGLSIVNIDHHHDMFGIGESLNCGNWLNAVKDKYPEAEITWIRNEDSEVDNFVGKDSTLIEDAKLESGYYDAIYLCRSALWSPPHLDKDFGVLNRFLAKRCAYPIFRQEIMNRWDAEYKKEIVRQREDLKQRIEAITKSINSNSDNLQ